MTKEKFRELFLNLTQWTIPFGEESRLESYLPTGFKKDSVGNYYYQIGKSTSLFTAHLDTYSEKIEKINHVVDRNDEFIIGTDRTTILGGDNKLGCCILIGMIESGIPGTYYFFVGEEPIGGGGLYGSTNALARHPDFFNEFERCIAFDRRGYGSIVVRQMGRMCCSPEFAKEIADEFNIRGVNWDKEGAYGYYTDTAVFMDVIPECTNISTGGFNEHTFKECVDLNYTYEVYKAAVELDWESLPVVREVEPHRFSEENRSSVLLKKYNRYIQDNYLDRFKNIFNILELRMTRNQLKHGIRYLTFSAWLDDFDIDVTLRGNKIVYDGVVMTMEELIEEIIDIFTEDLIVIIEDLQESKDKKVTARIDKILDIFNRTDIDDFLYELYDGLRKN